MGLTQSNQWIITGEMRINRVGSSTAQVSELGLGCWGLGGDSYGPLNEERAIQILHRAVARGVSYFDTSPYYGAGRSEELIGKALSSKPVTISTKFGLLSVTDRDFSVPRLRESLAGSMKRLNRERLDIVFFHSPRAQDIPLLGDAFRELEEWKKRGKILAIGASLDSPELVAQLIASYPVDLVQVNLNLLDQRILTDSVYLELRKREIGIIARTPLCFGFLTNQPPERAELPADDHRLRWSEAQAKKWTDGIQSFSAYLEEKTKTQLALRFCTSVPGVLSAIPGAMSIEQLEENLSALDTAPLSVDQLADIRRIYSSQSFFEGK